MEKCYPLFTVFSPINSWSRHYKQTRSAIGAYGHEQKHVKGSKTLVDKKVADHVRANSEGGWYPTKNTCMTPHAQNMRSLYQIKLATTLGSGTDHHRNNHPNDPAYADEPNEGDPIDQISGTPSIP
jgi:hypothetical protein